MPSAQVHDADYLAPPLASLLRALPVPRSGIVVGPPGSGKTVLAIELARQAAKSGPVQFLVASEHLVEWISNVVDAPKIEVKTWRAWLKDNYREMTGATYPIKVQSGHRQIDWPAVVSVIERATKHPAYQIIIDEAQDVPARLISALAAYAGNLMAFADPLQRHADDGSTVDELVEALRLDHPWPVYTLEEDFRTTLEIQRFATAAWAPSRLHPSRPSRNRGVAPRILKGNFFAVAHEAARVLRLEGGSVAIGSAHADRAQIASAVRAVGLGLNRGTEVDPTKISVLAFEALRGLEFDQVVVVPPRANLGSRASLASDLYVASTRARKQLTFVIVHRPFAELTEAFERAGHALESTWK